MIATNPTSFHFDMRGHSLRPTKTTKQTTQQANKQHNKQTNNTAKQTNKQTTQQATKQTKYESVLVFGCLHRLGLFVLDFC